MLNKKNILLFILVTVGILNASTQELKEVPVTIFVHGTYPPLIRNLFKNFMSVKPELTKISSINSDFHYIKKIGRYLANADSKEFPLTTLYAFGWPGKLDGAIRSKSGKILHAQIKKLFQDYKKTGLVPKITLIGHSHGGNVCLNIANHANNINNSCVQIERLILLGTPIQQETSTYASSPIFKKIYNVSSSLDITQILDPQKLHKENKHAKTCPFLSERRFKEESKIKQAKIKINDRAIMHVEFISKKFMQILPELLRQMDKLDDCRAKYLIKTYTNKKPFKIVSLNMN